VLFEAMSCGIPVVATEKSGASDCITTGIEGIIVPAGNAAALADAILWHYENPEVSAAMGRAARSKVESRFTLPHYVDRMIGIYHSVRQSSDKLKTVS
jgi:glycosyltransferase involved in cell wall biosynthesis